MQIRDDLRMAFLRWRDEGDLAALTTVFDRSAQELLLVASHVASAGQQPNQNNAFPHCCTFYFVFVSARNGPSLAQSMQRREPGPGQFDV